MHNRGQHANNDLKSITLKAIVNSKKWLTIIAKVSQFDVYRGLGFSDFSNISN